MTGKKERRKNRRASVRLGISAVRGVGTQSAYNDLWTTNISAGGMYFHIPGRGGFPEESSLSFELTVPPGSGYSAVAGKITGSGRVVRTHALDNQTVGIAIQFTQPLALDF